MSHPPPEEPGWAPFPLQTPYRALSIAQFFPVEISGRSLLLSSLPSF